MSRPDGTGTSQLRDKARLPGLHTTNWGRPPPPQARAPVRRDSEDVSPRFQGEMQLNDEQMVERRRKIEEAKARANSTPNMPSQASEPGRLGEQRAAAAPISTQSTLNSVSPELLTELRKIIREEFEQLHRANDAGYNISRPAGTRDRPTSPLQPFSSVPESNRPSNFSSKDVEERRADSIAGAPSSARRDPPTPERLSPAKREYTVASGASQVKSQQRDPPVRQNSVRFEDSETRTAATSATTVGDPSPTKSQQRETPVRPTSVRFSNETRPAAPPPPRVDETRKSSNSTDVEMTTIDKKWGVLFDKEGHTKRMEQVLRGLANYIIEEFLPQRSIVITPEKMAAFYSHHRLDKERFPFVTLFKSKSKDFNDALASLYEDLGCQYFLVQADNRSRPAVPSLTPQGFMRWIVTMVQACPDEEAKRLDNIVSALPIEADSLLDGKAERLPKQISRYLFPKEAARKTKRLVDEAMNDFEEDLQGSSSSRTKGSSSSSSNTGKPTPIVVTATSEKRSSTHTSSSLNSRYVPDSTAKEARGDDAGYARDSKNPTAPNSSRDAREDDRSRRNSMPAPPLPSKLGRSGTFKETHGPATTGYPGRAPTPSQSSFTRKNRSPQRNSYSQSVPTGLDRSDPVGDRFRSANISAAVANVAANALGASAGAQSSSLSPLQNPSSSTAPLDGGGGGGLRDSRNNNDQYHGKQRASLDEATPHLARSATPARDKVDVESGGASRQSKRRSMVLPDTKGPTWDDYLKSSAPRSATPAVGKKDVGYGSSHS